MRKFLVLLCLATSYLVSGQNDVPLHVDYSGALERSVSIPNTPEAAAFAQYGNPNVSLYTGTPNIGIPIYTHKGKELALPISLDYSATGIKVTQQATGAGLAWNLNVGGRITRMANGKPDDFITATPPYHTIFSGPVQAGGDNINQSILTYLDERNAFDTKQEALDYFEFLKNANVNLIDVQPDFFSFNALGLSEQFVFDLNTLTPKALNNPRITAEVTFSNSGNSIDTWKITNDDGTEFYFEQAEVTQKQGNDYAGPSGTGEFYGIISDYNSSWVLTKIVSPNQKDEYTFTYTDLGNFFEDELSPQAKSVTNVVTADNPVQAQSESSFSPMIRIKKLALSNIKYNGTDVVTINLVSRYDMAQPSAIDEIIIYNTSDSSTLKKFDLQHSYFKTSPSLDPADPSTNKYDIRLKLDAVVEQSALGTNFKTHTFEYHQPNDMPSRNSLARDYMELSNGINGTVLYPQVVYKGITFPGADRSPNFSYGIRGMLKKITYPTGGYTTFDFENHDIGKDVDWVNDVQDAYLQVQTGSDSNNASQCNAYCMDKYYYTPPNIGAATFMVPEGGTYQLSSITTNPTEIEDSQGEAYLIRLDVQGNTNPTTGEVTYSCTTALTYDQIIGSTGSTLIGDQIVWSSLLNMDEDRDIYLTAGCYQLMVIRGNDNPGSTPNTIMTSTVKVTHREGVSNTITETKAGFRIKDIKSYDNDDTLISHKEYRYKRGIDDAISSGVALYEPRYYYVTFPKFFNSDTENNTNSQTPFGINEREILHRSTSWSKGDLPHVAYERVYEITKKISGIAEDTPNGYTEHQFYLGRTGTGVAGLRDQASYYAAYVEPGKPKETHVYDANDVKLTSTFSQYRDEYYQSFPSLFVEHTDDHPFEYTLIYKDTSTNKYRYTYTPAQFYCWESSIFEGISCSGVSEPSNRPPVCFENDNECLEYSDYSGILFNQTYTQGRAMLEQLSNNMQFFNSYTVQQLITHEYEPTIDYQLRSVTTADSKDQEVKQSFTYAQEHTDQGSLDLIADHQKSVPIEVTQEKNGTVVAKRKNTYQTVGTGKIYLKTISNAKGNDPLTERVIVDGYDAKGNIIQTHNKDSEIPPVGGGPGVTTSDATSYIWGYDYHYPIVKATNAEYTELTSALSTLSQTVSSLQTMDNATLKTTLDQLRTLLPNAQITTYTYKPQIGVETITDPRGYTMTYTYDEFHRLKYVKDAEGNVLSKNEYHYAN